MDIAQSTYCSEVPLEMRNSFEWFDKVLVGERGGNISGCGRWGNLFVFRGIQDD